MNKDMDEMKDRAIEIVAPENYDMYRNGTTLIGNAAGIIKDLYDEEYFIKALYLSPIEDETQRLGVLFTDDKGREVKVRIHDMYVSAPYHNPEAVFYGSSTEVGCADFTYWWGWHKNYGKNVLDSLLVDDDIAEVIYSHQSVFKTNRGTEDNPIWDYPDSPNV